MRNANHGCARVPVGVVVLAVAASASGGCSALLTRPPPSTPVRSLSDCTRSNGPAIGDVIGAGVSGATAVLSLGIAALEEQAASNETVPSWDPHTRSNDSAGTFLTVGLIAGVAALGFVASARHGFRAASACRAASQELLRRQAPLAPPPYPAPPWGYPPYAPPR